MSDTTALLSQLRDIRTPATLEEPALWPVALSAILITVTIAALGFRFWKRRTRWAVEAKAQIKSLQQQSPDLAVQGFADLLKRIVLTRHPGQDYRTTNGDRWLGILDAEFHTDYFTKHQGRLFGCSLYRRLNLGSEERDLIAKRLCKLITKRSLLP